jgi:type II secretory pathway pseudopilin PulG
VVEGVFGSGDVRVFCISRRHAAGISLIEVAIATAVIGIAALGALSYEYHGVRQMQVARANAAAVRMGHFLLEDWKANGGSILYAKNSTRITTPDDLDMGFNYIGNQTYKVTVDNIPLRIRLTRPTRQTSLIPLTATIKWRRDFADAATMPDDPRVVLNAHARIDQGGG